VLRLAPPAVIVKNTGYDLLSGKQHQSVTPKHTNTSFQHLCAVLQRSSNTQTAENLHHKAQQLLNRYADCFPLDILIWVLFCRCCPEKNSTWHILSSSIPARRYNHKSTLVLTRLAAFQTLIQQHLDAGRIRLSKSNSTLPAFVIPKKDLTVLPRLVIDYCALKANTIKDKFPLPKIDNILDLAGAAKYWGKIDMTNSFFQT
jgi:hypothetical protein